MLHLPSISKSSCPVRGARLPLNSSEIPSERCYFGRVSYLVFVDIHLLGYRSRARCLIRFPRAKPSVRKPCPEHSFCHVETHVHCVPLAWEPVIPNDVHNHIKLPPRVHQNGTHPLQTQNLKKDSKGPEKNRIAKRQAEGKSAWRTIYGTKDRDTSLSRRPHFR
jgi:hypothetical protein